LASAEPLKIKEITGLKDEFVRELLSLANQVLQK
jgi:hypothetical protein